MLYPQVTDQQAKPKGTHERQAGKTLLTGEMERHRIHSVSSPVSTLLIETIDRQTDRQTDRQIDNLHWMDAI